MEILDLTLHCPNIFWRIEFSASTSKFLSSVTRFIKTKEQGVMNAYCGSKTYPLSVLLLLLWQLGCVLSHAHLYYERQKQLSKPTWIWGVQDSLPSFTEVTCGWRTIIFIMCCSASLSGLENQVISRWEYAWYFSLSLLPYLSPFSPHKPIHNYGKILLVNPIQLSKIWTLNWA